MSKCFIYRRSLCFCGTIGPCSQWTCGSHTPWLLHVVSIDAVTLLSHWPAGQSRWPLTIAIELTARHNIATGSPAGYRYNNKGMSTINDSACVSRRSVTINATAWTRGDGRSGSVGKDEFSTSHLNAFTGNLLSCRAEGRLFHTYRKRGIRRKRNSTVRFIPRLMNEMNEHYMHFAPLTHTSYTV